MSGGVGELVHTDVIMYHLMEDGVFHFLLRQVEGCADFQHETIFLHFAEELDAAPVAQLSEELHKKNETLGDGVDSKQSL